MKAGNDSGLRATVRLFWVGLALFSALAFAVPQPASIARYPVLVDSPTPAIPHYVGRVIVTAAPEGVPLPQDVFGVVLNRDGVGVPNVQVRIASPGWEAVNQSGPGGGFQFTLGQGGYTIELLGVSSQPAFVVIDGKSRVRVEFREALPPAAATATPTSTPMRTPTPTATATILHTPTSTATARLPVAEVVTPTSPAPTRTVVISEPPDVTVTSLLPLPDFDPGPWITYFLWGSLLGVVILVLGLLLSFVRR